jgi:glycosyltransferase involved in cell wall biosynthesis
MIKFYDKAKLTFIPLKESLQPSGQSVTLQSMARGVPVMITNASGFWDRLNYEHNKNILFIEENNAENWALNIKNFSKDQKKAAAISDQTLKTSSKLNNREAFFSLIKKNLNIQ